MSAFNFPASPVTGDEITNSDSGITYQYQAGGYWKSVRVAFPELNPPAFVFRQVGPPPNDLTELCRLWIPDGYQVDLTTFEYKLSANPAIAQDYDILVNGVRAADQINITTGGVVTINDSRGPYVGPLELSVYYELGGTIDGTFGTLTVVSPIEVV